MTTISERAPRGTPAGGQGAAGAQRLAYRPELDGVRAIAVLAVLGFHLAFMATSLNHAFSGGFLGVDIFFVLSGMLITELLVADFERGHHVSLAAFYRRRVQRLIPALVVVLVVVVGYFAIDNSTATETLHGLGSVVAYVTAGQLPWPFPAGISQVWTLVIEWEFYLLWPVVLIVLLRGGLSRRAIGLGALCAAALVTLIRAALFHHTGNWVLSYHFAWLRFDELLVGCAIGLLGARPKAAGWLRTVAIAGVVTAIVSATYPDSWLYEGGMFGLAIAVAIVVQPRVAPWIGDRVLASPPLVWVGKLSYSLYLWSVPAVHEVGRHCASWPLAPRFTFAVVVSFALAAASYYLIERRFRLPSRRALA
ncbi:MAG TPA: acyltransferase [Mycobacteriales bacterium]|nr:acyltransferase [Mycobacteriales bacterium]